jgi:hypothetical protein
VKSVPLAAVLDANVLYSALLRDFFMRMAVGAVFQPKWTEEIHEEWIEAVLRTRPDITRATVEKTRDLMDRYGGDWRVPAYQHLIPSLILPDLDDRHILAAAIAAKVPVIVTLNLSDFPATMVTPYGIRAIGPDAYGVELLQQRPDRFLAAVRDHRTNLNNPPKTPEEYLSFLTHTGMVGTAQQLQSYRDEI